MGAIGMSYFGVFIGVGMVVIGAAAGIGKLAGSALEGAARQPEALNKLQIMMIIPAAMIEGLGLLALIIALLAALAINKGVPAAGAPQDASTQAAAHP